MRSASITRSELHHAQPTNSPLFEEPTRSVSKNGVTFTPHDINPLLVLCSDDPVKEIEYVGMRNWGDGRSDPNEPFPEELHEKVFRKWGAELNVPFVLDIDPSSAVHNYAFDSGHVTQVSRPPVGFDPSVVPQGGEVKFYTAALDSAGFLERNRRLAYWIHTSDEGETSSGWIKNVGNTKDRGWTANPDFAWRPVGPGERQGKSQLNPQTDLLEVRSLHEASIAHD